MGTEAAGMDNVMWITASHCEPLEDLQPDDPVLQPIAKRADAACKLADAAEQMARAPSTGGKQVAWHLAADGHPRLGL